MISQGHRNSYTVNVAISHKWCNTDRHAATTDHITGIGRDM